MVDGVFVTLPVYHFMSPYATMLVAFLMETEVNYQYQENTSNIIVNIPGSVTSSSMAPTSCPAAAKERKRPAWVVIFILVNFWVILNPGAQPWLYNCSCVKKEKRMNERETKDEEKANE